MFYTHYVISRGRSEVLRCGLTRLSGDAGHRVLPVLATRDQWSHYWGGSDVQRVGKFFEVTAVAFLGLWACYFASFFLGVATMTVIGTVRGPSYHMISYNPNIM